MYLIDGFDFINCIQISLYMTFFPINMSVSLFILNIRVLNNKYLNGIPWIFKKNIT